MATGVLVVGVGKGTKQLNSFLGGTKTYETVVLFGKSTDTYDIAGKVVASASHGHITRSLVEVKLAPFRGKIQQVPPIYSSLKIDGMKAYDYARTGKELPRELQAREMEVQECELLEWYEGGKHDYRWPATEASDEDKQLSKTLMAVAEDETMVVGKHQKRKLSDTVNDGSKEDDESSTKKAKTMAERKAIDSTTDPVPSQGGSKNESDAVSISKPSSNVDHDGLSTAEKARLHTHEIGPLSTEICLAPAARIRLTVSSGFYVRSFANDLGIACGSLGIMASLVRSRQSGFDAASALTYQDLDGGEQVWGPKVQKMLDQWNERHPEEPGIDDRDKPENSKKTWGRGMGQTNRGTHRRNSPKNHDRERRNTSSGEE